MTVAAWLLGATLVATAAQAQHDHAADTRSRPVTLDAGLHGVHHPIQTTNVDAQKFFDQGLTLVYAFNHEEAVRSFEKASELDSMSPMPHSTTGAPTEGTLEIISALESVLARDANHVGANHYYIHATEASLTPERALDSAKRLETLVPAAGHLVHMPAHTYMRTGDYAGAVKANAIAADIDRKYITEAGPNGFYPTMYYNHNLDFLASAAMMTGQFARASEAADELVKNVASMIPDMPMVEPFGAKKVYVLLRFARWDAALALPMPDVRATVATTLFHFGRGVAHASLGAVADARRERAAYQAAKQRVPSDAMIGYNPASAVFLVCDAVLDARIAAAGHNLDSAIQAWQKAVAAEDALSYDEPADWFYSTRESLGVAYFSARRFEDADRTFREDLERNPGNPRSLFALWQMVGVRGEPDDPMTLLLRRRFRDVWTDADVELKLSDF